MARREGEFRRVVSGHDDKKGVKENSNSSKMDAESYEWMI